MPFKSEKQRRYLFANEPELAKKWSNMYGKKIIGLGGVKKVFFDEKLTYTQLKNHPAIKKSTFDGKKYIVELNDGYYDTFTRSKKTSPKPNLRKLKSYLNRRVVIK